MAKTWQKEVGLRLDMDESRLQLIRKWTVGECESEATRPLPAILVRYDSTTIQLHVVPYAVSPGGRNGHTLPWFHLVLHQV